MARFSSRSTTFQTRSGPSSLMHEKCPHCFTQLPAQITCVLTTADARAIRPRPLGPRAGVNSHHVRPHRRCQVQADPCRSTGTGRSARQPPQAGSSWSSPHRSTTGTSPSRSRKAWASGRSSGAPTSTSPAPWYLTARRAISANEPTGHRFVTQRAPRLTARRRTALPRSRPLSLPADPAGEIGTPNRGCAHVSPKSACDRQQPVHRVRTLRRRRHLVRVEPAEPPSRAWPVPPAPELPLPPPSSPTASNP